jgi:SAM-dependent methyltransferase
MTSPAAERFNRTAEGYLRWWAPVLAPASLRLVDRLGRIDPGLPGGEARDVLDAGCGTGSSLLEAARRWPAARLVGLDASVGMLALAGREAGRLPAGARERVGFIESDSASLPFADRSFDLVMTAFMLQLVPSRPPVLAEFRRVLRPGGIVAIAGWLTESEPFAPEAELEAALSDAGIVRPPRLEARSGHYRSAAAAAAELRRAGFRGVAPREETVDHTWTREDFAAYRETTRDRDLFEGLEPDARNRALLALERRLRALTPDQLVYRPPIVSLVGRRA